LSSGTRGIQGRSKDLVGSWGFSENFRELHRRIEILNPYLLPGTTSDDEKEREKRI